VILSSLNEEIFRRKTRQAGASGFISKDESTELLVKTIRQLVVK
jgi:DNA-binding NarL/FixJ family response regulator